MNVAIRVDASLRMGTGHAVRCLTLANALKEQGAQVVFLCRHLTDLMRGQIQGNGHKLVMLPVRRGMDDGDLAHSAWLGTSQQDDAADTLAALQGSSPDWLVVDHYALDVRWEAQLAPRIGHILVIDDLADRKHHCQILLDQNLQTSGNSLYNGLVSDKTRRLIGPQFALLRPEFRAAAATYSPRSRVPSRINLFFGGTDPTGVTLVALEALRGLPDLKIDVVVGADNPHRDAVFAVCRTMPQVSLHIQPNDIAQLLAQADLALGAAGSTSWERCCLGLPTLVIIVAPNQRPGAEALAKAGAAIIVGDKEKVSGRDIADAVRKLFSAPEQLVSMRTAAKALVDGRGTERVALSLTTENVTLRNAEQGDAAQKWKWRNDQRTRQYFNNPTPVSLATHLEWWQHSIAAPHRALLIARNGNIDIGVLRLDFHNNTATVSLYLDPDLTGLGLGPVVLRAGADWLKRHHPEIQEIQAEIHEDNAASAASFSRAEYQRYAGRLWKQTLS